MCYHRDSRDPERSQELLVPLQLTVPLMLAAL